MCPKINRVVEDIPLSGIRKIAGAAAELSRNGHRVYPFHLGMPDFDTPESIKEAAIAKLRAGHVHYTPNPGVPALQAAIASNIYSRLNVTVEPGSVIATVGASEAVAISLMAVLEPGTEVIVPTPCFPTYLYLPKVLGADVIQLPLSLESGFMPTAQDVEPLITEKTRAILINSPNNPTGAVICPDALKELIALARERDFWLISDEVYEDIVYDGFSHISALSLARDGDPVIYVSGLSKTYSMTGWRLGYLVAPEDLFGSMLKLHQYIVTSACSFVQWGAVHALSEKPNTDYMMMEYEKRRQSVISELERAGIDFLTPGGSFFVFPRIPDGLPDDEVFCHDLLRDYGLGLVPGTAFGDNFNRYFRVCYACSTQDVREGMRVLADALV